MLVNGQCSNSCGNVSMVVVDGVCVACGAKCKTCSIGVDNCTSCYTDAGSGYRYYHDYRCLVACP